MVQDENVAQRLELRRSSRPHHPPDCYGDHVWKLKGEKCSGRITCHNDVILWEQGRGTYSTVCKADPLSRLRDEVVHVFQLDWRLSCCIVYV